MRCVALCIHWTLALNQFGSFHSLCFFVDVFLVDSGSEILILMQDSLTRFLMSDLYKKCRKHIQVKSASITSTGSPSDMAEIGVVRNASSYRDIRLKYGLLDDEL